MDNQKAPAKTSTDQAVTTSPKPSMGRIVIYTHPGTEPREQSPAIVQKINADGSLKLWVFAERGITPTNAEQGKEAGQWDWPERA